MPLPTARNGAATNRSSRATWRRWAWSYCHIPILAAGRFRPKRLQTPCARCWWRYKMRDRLPALRYSDWWVRAFWSTYLQCLTQLFDSPVLHWHRWNEPKMQWGNMPFGCYYFSWCTVQKDVIKALFPLDDVHGLLFPYWMRFMGYSLSDISWCKDMEKFYSLQTLWCIYFYLLPLFAFYSSIILWLVHMRWKSLLDKCTRVFLRNKAFFILHHDGYGMIPYSFCYPPII